MKFNKATFERWNRRAVQTLFCLMGLLFIWVVTTAVTSGTRPFQGRRQKGMPFYKITVDSAPDTNTQHRLATEADFSFTQMTTDTTITVELDTTTNRCASLPSGSRPTTYANDSVLVHLTGISASDSTYIDTAFFVNAGTQDTTSFNFQGYESCWVDTPVIGTVKVTETGGAVLDSIPTMEVHGLTGGFLLFGRDNLPLVRKIIVGHAAATDSNFYEIRVYPNLKDFLTLSANVPPQGGYVIARGMVHAGDDEDVWDVEIGLDSYSALVAFSSGASGYIRDGVMKGVTLTVTFIGDRHNR